MRYAPSATESGCSTSHEKVEVRRRGCADAVVAEGGRERVGCGDVGQLGERRRRGAHENRGENQDASHVAPRIGIPRACAAYATASTAIQPTAAGTGHLAPPCTEGRYGIERATAMAIVVSVRRLAANNDVTPSFIWIRCIS